MSYGIPNNPSMPLKSNKNHHMEKYISDIIEACDGCKCKNCVEKVKNVLRNLR